MKIKQFTVENYRSITKAYKLPIDEKITVLLGKNNEGKSNMLRALIGTFYIISLLRRKATSELNEYILERRFIGRRRMGDEIDSRWDYIWERDYPIRKQGKTPKNGEFQPTRFRLDLLLDKSERIAFKNEVGNNINENLSVAIEIYKETISVTIPKRAYGDTGKVFTEKKEQIAKFISSRLDSVYIPAIRPASLSLDILDELLSKELRVIADEEKSKYEEAINIIRKIYQDNISRISSKLKTHLKTILRNIKDIEILYDIGSPNFSRYNNRCDIVIDDGVRTSIYEKGEGIKSLVALGIIRYSKESEKSLTLMVEEPEAHLHSGAIKQIKQIFYEISEQNQIIITTHSPLFVNRQNIGANIIVTNNNAKQVREMSEIRDSLGVAITDNLINSEIALIVEGKTDEQSISTYLMHKSVKLKNALKENRLVINYLGGVTRLAERKALLESLVFKKVICFVDFDNKAKEVIESAKKKLIISDDDYLQSTIIGYKEAEFEDYLKPDFYQELIPTTNANWRGILANKKKKWSSKIKELYSASGKDLTDDGLMDLKNLISKKVKESSAPIDAFCSEKISSLDCLVSKLESYF